MPFISSLSVSILCFILFSLTLSSLTSSASIVPFPFFTGTFFPDVVPPVAAGSSSFFTSTVSFFAGLGSPVAPAAVSVE